MRIESVRLHPYSAQRAYATQIAQEGGGARNQVAESRFIFLEATTNTGLTGWGEISDVPTAEYPNLETLEDEVTSLLVGRDPFDVQALHAALRELHPFDKEKEWPRLISAGVEMVCYDLQGQAAGVPVHKLLGGSHRENVIVSWVAFIREELDLLREEISERTAAGFTAFKLKVGVDIDLDEERLAVLREAAGPHVNLKIDPNGGWDLDAARKNIARLKSFNLAGVETPVAFRDAKELAVLRKETDVPLIEHVMTAEDALDYLRHESLDYFNIATTGCGGIWPARNIAEMAQTGGVGILLGSTVELGVGTLAQLHLAASIRGLTLPSDLVGPGLYDDDVLEAQLTYNAGQLAVPKDAGLGVRIDREKLS